MNSLNTMCLFTYMYIIRIIANLILSLHYHVDFHVILYIGPHVKVKVEVQVYRLISSLKTYHQTLHFTPWSLDLFILVPFQHHGEYSVLQPPFRRIALIVHIAMSFLLDIHFHLSQVMHLRVRYLAQGHNIETMRGEKHDISLTILHQTGFETARQEGTSANRCALTIVPFRSLNVHKYFILFILMTHNYST